MTPDHPLSILWRRRLLFLAALVVSMAAVAAVTFALPRVYRATATISVDAQGSDLSPDQLVHTYSSLAASPNVAAQVRPNLPYTTSTEELLDKMSFTPIETSQLFEITAEDSDARRAQTTANVYGGLFVRHVDAQIARGGLRQRASLSEIAMRPQDPARPDAKLSIGLGFLFSLIVAAAAVVLREVFDRRVRPAAGEAAVLGVPIVGRIPRQGRGHAGAYVDDAYRILRVNLEGRRQPPPRVIAVTSPSADEGKSTVAARLALAAGADGQTAVVLEADLRRPRLARALEGTDLAPRETGLSDYLAGNVHEIGLVTSSRSRVAAVFAGGTAHDPTGLLRSERMDRLIRHLSEHYDLVVIDCPPLPVGADARVLARLAEGTLLVVDSTSTKTPELASAVEQLRAIDADVLGVVINNAPVERAIDSYYSGMQAEQA